MTTSPPTRRAYHDANVKRAIEAGMSPEAAERSYGYQEPAKLGSLFTPPAK